MAKLPRIIAYGIVSINGRRIPRVCQIPLVIARVKVQKSEKGMLNKVCNKLVIGFHVKTEQRKRTQSIVILLGKICCSIPRFCRINYHADIKLGEIG